MDGDTWAMSEHVMDQGEVGAWDSHLLYRPAFHVNGPTAHLYYGGVEPTTPNSSWWIGKTEVPLRRWPDPPA